MSAVATLRMQIERSLEHRYPAALTPAARTTPDVAATGIHEVDDVMSGGLAVGAISELTGPSCSGRTSLALAFLAQRTAEGSMCAWIDTQDALDPESAAASGVLLNQLLWIRCRNTSVCPRLTRYRTDAGKDALWTRLDQALRATDLLLQAGGFAAIVLDLADLASEYASRIPLATWFRFRQAADRTRCSLLVLGRTPYAQSSAAAVLECCSMRSEAAGGTVLNGCTCSVQRGRERFKPVTCIARKPPASAWWAHAQWMGERCV